ncbi:MAG TPA: ribose 5-phosphate isomerase B [Bdellovibrionota bacterium]|jgi:ribose 5-phosphate isomerase B|nr:ribose 5-phosphate isomerase B [Bdellovibrionota bacterium]
MSVNAPLFIASDHGGFELKSRLLKELDLGLYQRHWVDLGPANKDSVDYPHYAKLLCDQVLETFERDDLLEPCGILICGSGVGVSIAANRFARIRAALCWSEQVAQLSRQHNASNVLCLGERIMDTKLGLAITRAWLSTKFEGGRHGRRVEQIDADSENTE